MRKLLVLLLFISAALNVAAQAKTYQFADREGEKLHLDFYTPDNVNDSTICVMFIFGGGFVNGARDEDYIVEYCNKLRDRGFLVASIDYRLGLKGVKGLSPTNYKPLAKAIDMAAEDAISALAYLVNHASELRVNKDKIVLVGSSAGAITALQTDYALCNGFLNSSELPSNFRIAGVVSYSGAIFSTIGRVKYRLHNPAPTMFMHGIEDKLVPYKQMKFFKIGFFGSSKLAKVFKKNELPYRIQRYEGYGHAVAMGFTITIDELEWFCRHYVLNKEALQIDYTYYDMKAVYPEFDKVKGTELYK